MFRPMFAVSLLSLLFCFCWSALADEAKVLELGKKLASIPKVSEGQIKPFFTADDDVRKDFFKYFNEIKFNDENRVVFATIVIKKDPLDDVRVGAANWLSKLKNNKSSQKAMTDNLTDKTPAIRAAACEGLTGFRGDPTLGNKFAKLLYDDAPEVRGASARALGKLGDRKQVPVIMNAYKKFKKDGDDDVYFGEALALLGETDVSLDIAKKCIESRSVPVRIAAVTAIECNPSMKTIPIIMANLIKELRRTISLDSSKPDWDVVYVTMCSELVKRTGKNYGNDAIGWYRWWDGVRKEYMAPAPAFEETLVSTWMDTYRKMGPSKIKE